MRVLAQTARGRWQRSGRETKHGQGGFTLIEVGLAITILVIAVVAMSASTCRLHMLRRQNREITLAQNAVRSAVEQIQALSQRTAQNTPDTWAQDMIAALAPGGAIGNTFDAREVDTQDGEASVGTIQIISDETMTDAALGLDMGMPRDLDGDGVADNADVSAVARILPVIVRVRWRGNRGNGQIEHPFYVVGY